MGTRQENIGQTGIAHVEERKKTNDKLLRNKPA